MKTKINLIKCLFIISLSVGTFLLVSCDKTDVNNEVFKAFTSVPLSREKLPKPELVLDTEGNRYLKALFSFTDCYYSDKRKLFFYFTTMGSKSLSKEFNLPNYILVFDANNEEL